MQHEYSLCTLRAHWPGQGSGIQVFCQTAPRGVVGVCRMLMLSCCPNLHIFINLSLVSVRGSTNKLLPTAHSNPNIPEIPKKCCFRNNNNIKLGLWLFELDLNSWICLQCLHVYLPFIPARMFVHI